jgi:hypothetical protein
LVVTVFDSLFSDKPKYVSAEKVLRAFSSRGKHYSTIDKIRNSQITKEEKSELKKTLPIICFGGRFTERKKDGLAKSSGLLTLDFDEGDLKGVREKLEKWNCTYACFSSPSGGDRFKALIAIPYVINDEEYKDFFNFFEEKYKVLDKSGKDISRASFSTYDENVYINPNAKVFTREMLNKYGSRPKKQTDIKLLNQIADWIKYAPKGERNYQCCKAGYYIGGLIQSGQLNENIAHKTLELAAIERGGEVEQSKVAIKESIEAGKRQPILNLQELERKIESMSKKADPTNFIVKREKIHDDAKKYYEGTGINSYKTGIEELDYYMSLRPNCFSVFVGGKAAGKTTLKLYLNTFLSVRHKLKHLVVSYENDAMELQDEVIGFLTGNSAAYVYRNNRGLYDKAEEWFHEHFTLLNFPPDFRFQDILDAAAKINSQDEYHELWIDPIFKVAGTDDYSENKLIARTAEPFANEEMGLFVSMHPTGSAQRQGSHVSDLNAEFGGLYSNAADITYAISRFYQDENESVRNTVNMSQDKVRSKKMLGGMETVKDCPIKWEYDWKKHNYIIHVPGKLIATEYTTHPEGLLGSQIKTLF